MGDQTKPVAFAGAGQPQAAPAGEPSATQEPVLTLDEVRRIAKEAEENAFRRSQGLFDKGQAKVRERIEQLEQTFKYVPGMTEEQKEAARQKAAYDALREPESPPAKPEPPAQARPVSAPELDPITASAVELEREYGFGFDAGDPEIAAVNTGGTVRQYLKTYEEALQAKRERLALPGAVLTARTPTNAGAGGRTTNPVLQTDDPDELWKMVRSGKRR